MSEKGSENSTSLASYPTKGRLHRSRTSSLSCGLPLTYAPSARLLCTSSAAVPAGSRSSWVKTAGPT
jgi:hypothetical protein